MKMAWYILFSPIFFAPFPCELFVILCCSFDQDHSRSNHLAKRDQPSREVAGMGKRDAGKATKKAGKCCTSIGLCL